MTRVEFSLVVRINAKTRMLVHYYGMLLIQLAAIGQLLHSNQRNPPREPYYEVKAFIADDFANVETRYRSDHLNNKLALKPQLQ